MNLGFKIIDLFRKTETVSCYNNLIDNQWFAPEKLKEIQFENLRKLLLHANKKVPYYTKKFEKYDFNVNKFSDEKDLEKIPVMTKDDVRENFDEIKALDFDKYQPRKTQTGGSTGKPFITYKDKLSHSYLWANNFRGWNAGGYNIGDKFIQIATGSLLPNTSSIKNQIYNYFQNSVLIPSYHLSENRIKEIIGIINSSDAKYIYSYSSTISLLADYCKNNTVEMRDNIKAIFTSSDMLYPHQRKNIEYVFKSKVFDIYGCPEGGIMTFECNEHNGYHLNQESVHISIGKANSNGIGNIISTPLFNYSFPLIRYNTGDVGKLNKEKCSCGRGLIKISELGGRVRDFVILEDGRYIHGAFFNHLDVLYNSKWVNQYQIIQESINEITLKFSCSSDPTSEELKNIESILKKGLLPNLKINFDLSGVEYTNGGKFRLIISKVKNEWE